MSNVPKADAWIRRVFTMTFILIVALNLLVELLRTMNNFIHQMYPLILLLVLMASSGVAYAIRQRRHKGRLRAHETSARGGERTPILPRGGN